MVSIPIMARAALCVVFLLGYAVYGFPQDKKISSALSHYIMAIVKEDLGNIDEAIPEYKRALASDPRNSVLHVKLASCYVKKNDFPKAIAQLKDASRLDPEAVEPLALLALIYTTQNDSRSAQVEYEAALKNASRQEPENVGIYRELGILSLQQKKFKEAESTYLLILKLSPDDSQAHFYLGNVYYELKKNAQAIEELKKAIQLKPDYHEALNYLGYVYVEENKNLDEARLMIEKALVLDPDNGAYVDSLGWLYFKQAKFAEAQKELSRASTLLEDPVIYDHLGDVYQKVGDLENAKTNWRKALKLDPMQEKIINKIGQFKDGKK